MKLINIKYESMGIASIKSDTMRRHGARFRKLLFVLLSIFIVSFTLAPKVGANSAEPPMLTVVVTFPSDNLTLSIRFSDGRESEAIVLQKEQKAWEAYYRFFYGANSSRELSLDGAVLIVHSGEKSFECPLPSSAFSRYNNILTLDVSGERITEGQSFARSFLLVALRIALTIIIEGLVFFAFGYRNKRSWLTFLFINLITQGALNIMLNGFNLGSYWIFGYIFFEIIIFIAEIISFPLILKERGKGRAALYAFTANLASLILGGVLLSYLPI